MTTYLPRSVLLGALMFASMGLAGCGGVFGGAAPGYDEQGCVENALRRNPDPKAVQDARELFAKSCQVGDAGACSALGVLYELGRGVPHDPARAVALYRKSCSADNARGCSNLGLALEHGLVGLPSADQARTYFKKACDEGERSGCSNLGRLYSEGKAVGRDVVMAVSLLEKSCDQGETPACMQLASILGPTDPTKAIEIYVKACVAGDPVGCEKLRSADHVAKAAPLDGQPTVASK